MIKVFLMLVMGLFHKKRVLIFLFLSLLIFFSTLHGAFHHDVMQKLCTYIC